VSTSAAKGLAILQMSDVFRRERPLSNVHGIDDVTALVGMPELVVRGQVLRDGEWWLAVETRPGPQGCPGCGVRAVGHGRSRTTVRDLPIAGVPTVLVFARRRWRCPEPRCEVRTWSEHVDTIAPRVSLTERARARLAESPCVETNATRMCALVVGLRDVTVIGVAEWPMWLRIVIEAPGERPACCCGGVVHRHGVREVELVDLPVFGRPARLVWRKQRWRCTPVVVAGATRTLRSAPPDAR
jgi:transposase